MAESCLIGGMAEGLEPLQSSYTAATVASCFGSIAAGRHVEEHRKACERL